MIENKSFQKGNKTKIARFFVNWRIEFLKKVINMNEYWGECETFLKNVRRKEQTHEYLVFRILTISFLVGI